MTDTKEKNMTVTVTVPATKDVLVKARKMIADGWTQGVDRDADGNVCSVGAIHRAVLTLNTRGEWTRHMLAVAAAGVVGEAIFDVYPWVGQVNQVDIVSWNDAPERTQDEVLYVFDHAIKLAATERSST